MMVHTDKKHFKCCACPAQFKGRENLRKHVVKFHNELLKNVSSSSLFGSSSNIGDKIGNDDIKDANIPSNSGKSKD